MTSDPEPIDQEHQPLHIDHAVNFSVTDHHVWRQRGSWIVCVSCDQEHGFGILPGQRLLGVVDGKPIIG